MAKSFVNAIPFDSVNTNTFGAGFVPVNINGLDQACFLIRIVNASNVIVTISYDGVVAHDVVLPNETIQLNLQANSSPNGFIAYLRKGTIVYVDAVNAGVGFIFLAGYYQEV